MRWKVAWSLIGCGVLLGACGSTSKNGPRPEAGCEPGARFCQDRQVWLCDEDGSATLIESCSADEVCSEDDNMVSCRQICFSGEPTCDGDTATLCNADGTGPEPGGDDCAEAGQVCELGECVEPDCDPGQPLCRNDDLFICGESGKDVARIDECTGEEVCDAVLGACSVPLCEAGALGCDETRVIECNAAGTAWDETGVDCADDGQICSDGECVDMNCTPGYKQCMDGVVYQCTASGQDLMSIEVCSSNQECVDDGASMAYCSDNPCTPNQVFCNENQVKTCTEDGMIPEDGVDCGDDACFAGECMPVICEIFETACYEGHIQQCQPPGVYYSVTEECAEGTSCGTLEGLFECMAVPCTPEATDCVGNVVGTCGADGQTLASASEDCAGSGNVCDASNTCAASAVDSLGVGETVGVILGNELAGNLIDVHSARLLIDLEANLILSAPRDLRWVIYEWNGLSFELGHAQITTNQSSSGYFSSGALDFELQAGKRYFLGVGVVADDGNVYYDDVPWNGELSFGNALGGVWTSYAESINTYIGEPLYALRLTTELP